MTIIIRINICENCLKKFKIKNSKEQHCRTNCAICGEFDWYFEVSVTPLI